MWNTDVSFCTTESWSVAISYATAAASFLISSQRVTHIFIDLNWTFYSSTNMVCIQNPRKLSPMCEFFFFFFFDSHTVDVEILMPFPITASDLQPVCYAILRESFPLVSEQLHGSYQLS